MRWCCWGIPSCLDLALKYLLAPIERVARDHRGRSTRRRDDDARPPFDPQTTGLARHFKRFDVILDDLLGDPLAEHLFEDGPDVGEAALLRQFSPFVTEAPNPRDKSQIRFWVAVPLLAQVLRRVGGIPNLQASLGQVGNHS